MTRHPLWWGVWLLLGLAAAAVVAPMLAPYDPDASLDLIGLKSQPPSWAHPFGTDPYSRDVLSRVLHGTRVSLSFSLLAVGLVLVIGTLYGALMAFAPPVLATVLRRTLDLLIAIPRLLILLAVAGVAGPLSITVLVLLTAGTGWYACARLVHDELVALRTREFTIAARATGVPVIRLVFRHLMPHVAPTLMTLAALAVAGTIGLEAGLSFLGLGIQPPTASWGNIIRDGAGLVQTQWWLTVFPSLAMLIPVLACNAVGDALRDRFASTQFGGSAASASSSPSLLRSPFVLRP
jgi:peptide/nickel transport system permease protein